MERQCAQTPHHLQAENCVRVSSEDIPIGKLVDEGGTDVGVRVGVDVDTLTVTLALALALALALLERLSS